ncbi:helix-turn-helix transcriptional regulator [Celeribacter naphthalenivorans]|uniref:helix-turn-helix transcriptional regulator n=1 Tax=Celeribacter naphthalenivorans TaxID=1614694 RepID=UPI001CF9CA62
MSAIFLSDVQVAERYGVHRVTIWRWSKTDPTFPKPIMLSPGCSRFRLSDIENWEASKAEGAA